MEWLVVAVAGLIGIAIGWLAGAGRAAGAAAAAEAERQRRESAEKERDRLAGELQDAAAKIAEAKTRAEEAQIRLDEERRLLADAERRLADAFKSLAADTLRQSTDDLLRIAEEKLKATHDAAAKDFEARHKAIDDLVKPARESLERLDSEIRKIENERRGSEGRLAEQLRSLGAQTTRLVDALKTPSVRGRWGEVQLRRVVEIAGMVEHCDFFEQEEQQSTEGGRLRPDMRVQLPGGKSVVVDSKVPLKAYLEAMEAQDEAARAARLAGHAGQIRSHIALLSSKAYWDACRPTPEFVVLFLPGEMFFSAALQQDPALIEDAADRKVILATPTTLIALLKAVAYGWRQEQLAENAERISALGRELHERVAGMAAHFAKVGLALGKAVEEYNDTARTMESRVLISTRRFRELGVASRKEVEELPVVESAPRAMLLASGGRDSGAG